MKESNDISQELLETIERYLNGNLNTQELKDFKRLLDLDEDFKAQVEDVRTMLFGSSTKSLEKVPQDIQPTSTFPQAPKLSPKQKARYVRYSRIAAAAAIVIAVGSIWFFSTPQNEKLYYKYFKPDIGLPIPKENITNVNFYDAMANYNSKDYSTAIAKWTDLLEQKPANDTLNYFLGIALLANKKEAEAIPFLERTIQSKKDFILQDNAYYYLALAYLKKGNFEIAKEYLEISKKSAGKELLSKLKK